MTAMRVSSAFKEKKNPAGNQGKGDFAISSKNNKVRNRERLNCRQTGIPLNGREERIWKEVDG